MEHLSACVYRGKRGQDSCSVTVDGEPLDPLHQVGAVPAAEFEWGYKGGGPGRLAFAILAHHFGDSGKALAFYKNFRDNVIAELADEEWALDSAQIDSFLNGVVTVSMTLEELLNKVRGRST